MLSPASLWRPGAFLIICSLASFGLAGCLVGGSGALGPAAPRPAPAPLGAPQDPQGSPEFKKNDGLDIINAQAAYIRGATGNGVTVAVIDTGIDVDHPDLAGNISAASTDITSSSGGIDDASGHGTMVAGVIAAGRNGLGSHGVAYDASILAIKTARCNDNGCLFYMADLANAVIYATDNLAHVINMSLGGNGVADAWLNIVIGRAVNAGAFVVIAAGNGGLAEPYYPANLAADPALAGMVVSVVAVSDSGAIASFSNQCGKTMDSCLAAPGISIVTTRDGATDATQTTAASGTSFAAPHVSGALALLIQLYPDAYAGDARSIAMFMFDGARDLGAAGVDPVYGHGLLDVAGAIATADAAIAAAAIPLSSGISASLAETSLALSPAFGDALANLGLLDSAIAVIRLSDGEHPYRARLADRVIQSSRGMALDWLIAPSGIRGFSEPLGGALWVSMALADNETSLARSNGFAAGAPEDDGLAMRLAGSLGDATAFRLGIDVAAPAQLGGGGIAARAGALFAASDEMISPVALLAGRGTGLSLDRSVGGATTLSLGVFDGDTADVAPGGGGGTRLSQASLSHGFGARGALRIDAGVLGESASLLGGQGAGAFATRSGASTRYLALSGGIRVGRRVEVLGGATMAATGIGEAPGGVLGNWDTVHSNAFAFGAIARDVFAGGDRLGILVGQPLRARDAAVTVTVPVALDADGQILRRSERVDMTPDGREIDLQLVYRRALGRGADLSSWLLLRRQPGHDRGAAAGFAAGLRFDYSF